MFYDDVMESAEYLRGRTGVRPGLAIILGSGLGGLAEAIADRETIPYEEIPHFPRSRLAGHEDRLVLGRLGGTPVAAMQGRFHYYEGFSMRQVAYPVFVLWALGARDLIVTNACGGINEAFAPGDLMLIEDYINLIGQNPLIGENDERFGPRFPDMSAPYDPALRAFAEETAAAVGIRPQKGVYALFSGPCFETAAEIRAYRALGADAVGMSTVPETIAANYLGMRVLGLSCVTNMATGLRGRPHSHEEVLAVAAESGARLCAWVRAMAERWPAR